MKLTRDTHWIVDQPYARVLRFMQDQPMVHVRDLQRDACFATRVAASIEVSGLSTNQVGAIEKIIERRRWIEPPRFHPWAQILHDKPYWAGRSERGDVYEIIVCPGAPTDGIRALQLAKPADMHGEMTIGPIYEYTRDVDDPRIDPTPAEKRRGKRARYTTVCRRLVEEARSRGLLIEPDGPNPK